MYKRLVTTTLTVVLLLTFSLAYCQNLKADGYYIVKLKGEIVSNILNTYSQFDHFDFTFKKLDDGKYALSGYASDADKQPLGDEINLIPLTDHHARSLKNLEKGHLYLYKTTMQEHDVDGSEDYILTPMKCKDHSGQSVDYVSYRFNNKIDDSDDDGSTGSLTAVKAFTLNPSPPY